MRRVTLACTLLLSLLAAGCGDDDDGTPTSPTTPSPTVTDTFTGTLTPNGATSHPFPVVSAAGGDVIATLKAVTPDGAAVLGMSLGTWSSTGGCQAVISNDRATVSASILGQATTTGTLCLRVYDVGALSLPQDYEVEVVHP